MTRILIDLETITVRALNIQRLNNNTGYSNVKNNENNVFNRIENNKNDGYSNSR